MVEFPHNLESFTDNTHWVWEQQKLQLIFKEIVQYLDFCSKCLNSNTESMNNEIQLIHVKSYPAMPHYYHYYVVEISCYEALVLKIPHYYQSLPLFPCNK
jgi:hypothetical protein